MLAALAEESTMARTLSLDVIGQPLEEVTELRRRITAWLHQRGYEPSLTEQGGRLLVDFGDCVSDGEHKTLVRALRQHLALKGGL